MRRRTAVALMLGAPAAYCAALRMSPALFDRHRAALVQLYTALGRMSALHAAPVAEPAALCAAAAVVALLLGALVISGRRRSPAPLLRCMAALTGAALLLGCLLWPAPLDGSPRAQAAYSRAYTTDGLERLILALDDSLRTSGPDVDLSGPTMRLSGTQEELASRVAEAYARAGLSAIPARAPRWPQWMARLRIAGLFAPFTGELLINPLDMDSALPFTMLHETAHSLGAFREDEANLTALLVGMTSGDAELMWASALTAMRYALDTLRAVDAARFEALLPRLDPLAVRELHAQGAFRRAPRAPAELVLPAGDAIAVSAAGAHMRRTTAADSYDGLVFLLLDMMH